MKNWCLILVIERDIKKPRFFDTKEEAQEAMCADLACVLQKPLDEIKKAMINEHWVEDFAEIYEDYAWSDFHMNYDWQIFDVSDFCIEKGECGND